MTLTCRSPLPNSSGPTQSARDEILAKLRRGLPVSTELPDLSRSWTTFPDPVARFAEVLSTVGGVCVAVPDLAAANQSLATLEPYSQAVQRVSFVEGVGENSIDPGAVASPHELRDVDFAVLPGLWAVAENAAVWVATDDVLQRTLYFLSQHIALVVPADRIVHSMHEAYSRIDVSQRRFGTFLSGPSKTADIEQALVIGAHGARSLTVYLVG